jgi:hypothetical protein
VSVACLACKAQQEGFLMRCPDRPSPARLNRASRAPLVRAIAASIAVVVALGASTAVPARAQAETTGPDHGSRVVVSLTIPANDLPAGPAVVGLGRFELAPGTSVGSPPGSQPPSVAVEVVLDGQYGVVTDGRAFVERAGAGATPGASPVHELTTLGQEVTLAKGEAIVYLDNGESNQVARNVGDTPVVGLAFGVFSTQVAMEDLAIVGDYRFDFLDFAPPEEWAMVPAGPVTLTLVHEPPPGTVSSGEPPVQSPVPASTFRGTPPTGTLVLQGVIDDVAGRFVLTVTPAGDRS